MAFMKSIIFRSKILLKVESKFGSALFAKKVAENIDITNGTRLVPQTVFPELTTCAQIKKGRPQFKSIEHKMPPRNVDHVLNEV